MNRDHQTIRDHGFDCAACGHRHQGARLAYICIGCPCTHNEESLGDSTPPATPVEPTCVACDKGDHQTALERLTQKASDILNEHGADRYRVGVADGILEALEVIERLGDTRDAALRTLVEQWRKKAETADTVAADLMDRDGRIRKRTQAYYLNACADALDAILKETTP